MDFRVAFLSRDIRLTRIRVVVAAACIVVAVIAPAQLAGATPYNETVLYSFQGGHDGISPSSRLIFDSSGALYGTTGGGSANAGTVFKLTPPAAGQTQWTEALLYSFKGEADGDGPSGGLIFDTYGALYGTTSSGGPNYVGGSVFRLTPPEPYIPLAPWTETELHSFTGGSDGNSPAAGLIFDTHGALYGATQYGGTGQCISYYPYRCGVVFKLCPLPGGEVSGGKLPLLPCDDHNPEATPSAAR